MLATLAEARVPDSVRCETVTHIMNMEQRGFLRTTLRVPPHLSVFRHNPLRNKLLFFGTLAAQAVHIGAMYTPGLREVLGVQPVSLAHWSELLALALVMLLAMEAHKRLRYRSPGRSVS